MLKRYNKFLNLVLDIARVLGSCWNIWKIQFVLCTFGGCPSGKKLAPKRRQLFASRWSWKTWEQIRSEKREEKQRRAEMCGMPLGTGSGWKPRGKNVTRYGNGSVPHQRNWGSGVRFGEEKEAAGDLKAITKASCGLNPGGNSWQTWWWNSRKNSREASCFHYWEDRGVKDRVRACRRMCLFRSGP